MYVIQRLISRIIRLFPSKIQTAYLLAILCTIPILLFIRYKYGPLQMDSSFKKTKIFAIIVGILFAIYTILTIIPYISFNHEQYDIDETAYYKDVEIKITDIDYVDTYKKAYEYVSPKDGYTFMQITLEINNLSEEDFYYGSSHWDIKGYDDTTTLKKKHVYTCVSNIFDNYETISPNASITQTLTYEVPLQLKDAELQYLASITYKTSQSISIREAPDFIITLDEE